PREPPPRCAVIQKSSAVSDFRNIDATERSCLCTYLTRRADVELPLGGAYFGTNPTNPSPTACASAMSSHSVENNAPGTPGCWLRAADERAGTDRLQCGGGRDRSWRRVLQGPRLRRLVGTCRPEADLDRGPYDPRQDIEAWQSLPPCSLRP